MADAPTAPPPPYEPGRVYTLRDLPLDTLSLILSFIPFPDRFRHPRWACRELAAASVPPSVAWKDVEVTVAWETVRVIKSTFVTHSDVYGIHGIPAAKAAQLAATAVRRVSLHRLDSFSAEVCKAGFWEHPLPLFVPYMEELVLCDRHLGNPSYRRAEGFRLVASWLAPLLAAATRLTRLEFCEQAVPLILEGPPGMIAGGHVALADFAQWLSHNLARPARAGGGEDEGDYDSDPDPIRDYYRSPGAYPYHELHRGLTAAAADAGHPVRLAQLGKVRWGFHDDDHPTAGRDLAVAGGAGLTALCLALPDDGSSFRRRGSVSAFGGTCARLAPILNALPGLRELYLEVYPSRPSTAPENPVRGWPPGLTKLSIRLQCLQCVVTLPPAVAARLESLTIRCVPPPGPPACLADPACAFTRLKRLAYEGRGLNLAPWSEARFHLPNLVEMEVSACSVTLEGGLVGQAWAEAMVENLPRLAVLKLVPWEIAIRFTMERPAARLFACNAGTHSGRSLGETRCAGCGAEATCPEADVVADAVLRGLPAAAAAAGRRLVVRVQTSITMGSRGGPLESDSLLFGMTHMLLKYEPVAP